MIHNELEKIDLEPKAHRYYHLNQSADDRINPVESSNNSLIESIMHTMLTTFEIFGVGSVLLMKNGEALALNKIAERITEARDGLILSCNRRFATCCAEENKVLQNEITRAIVGIDRQSNIIKVSKQDRRAPAYSVTVLNLDLPMIPDTQRPYACMFIVSPDRMSALSSRHIENFFSLTPAEAKLAVAVTQGISLADYAEDKCGLPPIL